MEKYLVLIFILYLLMVLAGYGLEFLNLSHLKKYGASIPPEFEGHIDQGLLNKTRDYVVENTKFEFISSLVHHAIILAFLFGKLLNGYNTWIASLKLPFILSGIVFLLLLMYAETALSIPFNLYHTFKIENKYGFTTTTMRLWITDHLKSLAITTIMSSLAASVGLFLVQASPHFWWFWVWCFFFALSILFMYAFPYVIEPLFNKFTPLDDETLQAGICRIMQKAGIQVQRVFKMDASRRTNHTNAYFTGIGKVKRIVLYDTLLEKLDKDEILATLAHEAGHWKKRHLLKHLIVSEAIAFFVMFLSFHILKGDSLTHLFSIKEGSFFSKIVILGFIGSIAAFPFTPVFHYFSRRHEVEADRFSCELTGDARGMINALIKLSRDNLSNLRPHPLYAAFHYSHPPVLKRIRDIRARPQPPQNLQTG